MYRLLHRCLSMKFLCDQRVSISTCNFLCKIQYAMSFQQSRLLFCCNKRGGICGTGIAAMNQLNFHPVQRST